MHGLEFEFLRERAYVAGQWIDADDGNAALRQSARNALQEWRERLADIIESGIKVVETDTAPKAKVQGGMFVALEGAEAGTEPLGDRILEVPVSAEDTEVWRNSRSGFVAYVPPGSLKKGEALVVNGITADGGKVTACTVCHAGDLRGLGPVPPLAGRSPSYLVRQLYDMQRGNRNGR